MHRRRPRWLLLWPVLTMAAAAQAQGGEAPLALRALVSTCAACHGTEGAAVSGAGMPTLRGLDRQHLRTQLLAFRDGTRPATVMHHIARGYTPEQIDALAAWFASPPGEAP